MIQPQTTTPPARNGTPAEATQAWVVSDFGPDRGDSYNVFVLGGTHLQKHTRVTLWGANRLAEKALQVTNRRRPQPGSTSKRQP